jgi:ATP-dependent DNA ligase
MSLPFASPLLPMLAKRVDALPEGPDWIFEPKWDGFRVIVFRDGDEVTLQSRDGKSLNRYFPELLSPLLTELPLSVVLDGEIVVAGKGALDFETLQARVHPAASRVKKLAVETPASLVFWDVLALEGEDWRTRPFDERRAELENVLRSAKPPILVTPATRDRAVAEDWFTRFEGAGFDGVMAKRGSGVYEPDKRVML